MYSPSRITALSWQRGFCNSMNLWARMCRATQDGWVIVKSSDKTRSTGGGNSNPLQYSCCENPRNSVKRQMDMIPEDEDTRLEGVQYAAWGEQRAITNSFRKNEVTESKWKWRWIVAVSGGESKVWCYKEQYFIRTWNVRSMNQGKLDEVWNDWMLTF